MGVQDPQRSPLINSGPELFWATTNVLEVSPVVVPNFPPDKKALTRREAAQVLAISVSTLDREVASGRIAHLRIGRRVLFRLDMLDDYTERVSVPAKK